MLPDANELVDTLKRAAVEAVKAGKPVNVYFGEVVSASPLKINVEQKMILGEKQLVLSRNVTDFKTKITAGNIKNYYYTGDVNSGTVPVSTVFPLSHKSSVTSPPSLNTGKFRPIRFSGYSDSSFL